MSSSSSRAMSPMPEQRQRRFRDVHPSIFGGLIGSALTVPASAIYYRYRKPINKFIGHVGKGIGNGIGSVGNYAARMTQNALRAMWNTPFRETSKATTSPQDRPTPNPTPRASSGNEEYDRNHKNTISEKH